MTEEMLIEEVQENEIFDLGAASEETKGSKPNVPEGNVQQEPTS